MGRRTEKGVSDTLGAVQKLRRRWGGWGGQSKTTTCDYVRGREGGQRKTNTYSGKVIMKSTTVVDYLVEAGCGV